MDAYREEKKQNPGAKFTLRSERCEDLKYLTTEKKGHNMFKASIQIRVSSASPDM